MSDSSDTRADDAGPYSWYVVGVLILAYCFSFIDRQALTLMVGPIRETLNISDTQLSLLHGFAFALFYTVMGIPIGRMVDQQRRTRIIAVGIIVWSVMTAVCGLAKNFGQMFLARIGVGVGEAALSPAAYSMIGDYFPPHQRAKALSLYISAAYVGSGLAIMIGGALITLMPALDLPVVGRIEPWQCVFIAIGLPGLLVALLVVTLKEPARTGMKAGVEPSIAETLRYIATRKATFATLIGGFALSALMWNGAIAWLPTFFMRIFGWTTGEVGFRYGLTVMVSGVLGAVCGGALASRLRERGILDANLRVGLVSLVVALPGGLFATMIGSAWPALIGVFVFLFGCSMPYGAAVAALQEITPNQMRGQVSAIYLFCISFLGMGVGPTTVAVLTDSVFASDAALGQSLAVMMAVSAPLSALVLWAACKHFRRTLKQVDF